MWAIGAVLPLVMLAAVAVDTGYILVARSQLQGSIDAGATATLLALQRGLPQGAAEAATTPRLRRASAGARWSSPRCARSESR